MTPSAQDFLEALIAVIASGEERRVGSTLLSPRHEWPRSESALAALAADLARAEAGDGGRRRRPFRRKRRFSGEVMREAYKRSGGICECGRVPQLMQILRGAPCGVRLNVGDTFYEHIVCDELGGSGALDNCAVLTRTCWRLKTDRYDLPAIAAAKSRADRHHGIRKARHPLPGGRDDPRKRTMRGQIIDRATGERWGR